MQELFSPLSSSCRLPLLGLVSFFFSVLRFFFRLPSVVSFSFFGHPSESLWSSFGHPIMSLLCPFKEIPSSLPPFSLTVFQFSIFNFQFIFHLACLEVFNSEVFHFSTFNIQFTFHFSFSSPRPTFDSI